MGWGNLYKISQQSSLRATESYFFSTASMGQWGYLCLSWEFIQWLASE